MLSRQGAEEGGEAPPERDRHDSDAGLCTHLWSASTALRNRWNCREGIAGNGLRGIRRNCREM